MIRWLLGAFWLVVVSIGLNMAASELFGYGTRAGLWFVRRWVRLLPPDQRDRWREEWEADVIEKAKGPDPDKTGGNHHLTAMAWGFWTLRAAVPRSRLLPRWVHSDNAEQQVAMLVFGLGYGLVIGLPCGLVVGPIVGLIVGLVGGVVLGPTGGVDDGPIVGRGYGLGFGLLCGLIGGLVVGLDVGLVIGLLLGLIVGLVFGLLVWLFGRVIGRLGPTLSWWAGRRLVAWARRRV